MKLRRAKPRVKILWQAQHEGNDYSEWDLGGYGGHQDDPAGTSVVDSTHAHSGRYSLKMTSDTTGGQNGTRNFRWAVDQAGNPVPNPGIYTCWYYFDTAVVPGAFWNIMQWKTKNAGGGSDPDFMVDIFLDGANGLRLYIYDLHLNTDHGQYTPPNALTLNTWHRVDVTYTWDLVNGSVFGSFDGTQFYAVTGVATQWPTAAAPNVQHWSVNNYSDSTTPAVTSIWADDATIVDPELRKVGAWATRSGRPRR